MSRFNSNVKQNKHKVIKNLAGGNAYDMDNKFKLISTLLTSFNFDKFYLKNEAEQEKIRELINNIPDIDFLIKLALYTRLVFGNRTSSHILTAEIIDKTDGIHNIKNFFNKIIYRLDDMLEISAYYQKLSNNHRNINGVEKLKLPTRVKKGFYDAFDKFDDFSIARYQNSSKDISLIDIVNLIHPRPTTKNEKSLKHLVKGKLSNYPEIEPLKQFDTLESELSYVGSDKQKRETVFRNLILKNKIKYIALIKNVIKILEGTNEDPEILEQICNKIIDKNDIRESMMYPFRYLQCYLKVKDSDLSCKNKIIDALNKAVEYSCDIMSHLSGESLIVIDTSGSMTSEKLAGNKELNCSHIAALFGAIFIKKTYGDIMFFSVDSKRCYINPNDTIFTIYENIIKENYGGGTNMPSVLDLLINEVKNSRSYKKYKRIIILSDFQSWIGPSWDKYETKTNLLLKQYKNLTNTNPKLYSFDLAGYGTLQIPQNDTYYLCGFSDEIFSIIPKLENDKNALIHEIEKMEF